MTLVKLNLGAGADMIGDAVNHDIVKHRPEIAIVWDLNRMPWPWQDETFEHIIAKAVFEHLRPTLVESLNECWRILKPGGTVFVKVPWVGNEHAFDDPTHQHWATIRTFDYFDPDRPLGREYPWYTERKWQVLSVEYNKGESPASTAIIAKLQVRK